MIRVPVYRPKAMTPLNGYPSTLLKTPVFNYDKGIDALYVKVRDSEMAYKTEELVHGLLIVDRDEQGQLIGFEILGLLKIMRKGRRSASDKHTSSRQPFRARE